MFDRNKRNTNEENGAPPIFEEREPIEKHKSQTRAREAAIIGPSIQINGDLSGEEDLIIQGKVSGTIQLSEKSLTVGKQGQVDANVLAYSVIVEGKVNGDLYGSERVSIRKTGNVNGNIVSPKVSLEEGCSFKGSIDMDREMTNKAFGKPGAPTSVSKPELSPTKPKTAEVGKQTKSEKPATGSDVVNSGTTG
ncbi:MAG: polymer-forming cytoskeletal protein [Candidatus Thiodiazotropha sp. (ex Lucinoma borealis)]|nr:polymer-forming cytoskeletal protein [Candidatus Thiodiazotropha sp. (ex Lucinoma borealis)]MCU7856302.1 polymer-forming cytoskeletal protein [Candidatus Thiodiazotropha sp. (ex Lucinoma borealis)]MCU7869764.1 polymer-forming cytoskeletal protein [Candidatus Thiodiazotropha sp. (ex Lucinoma borealis)]